MVRLVRRISETASTEASPCREDPFGRSDPSRNALILSLSSAFQICAPMPRAPGAAPTLILARSYPAFVPAEFVILTGPLRLPGMRMIPQIGRKQRGNRAREIADNRVLSQNGTHSRKTSRLGPNRFETPLVTRSGLSCYNFFFFGRSRFRRRGARESGELRGIASPSSTRLSKLTSALVSSL